MTTDRKFFHNKNTPDDKSEVLWICNCDAYGIEWFKEIPKEIHCKKCGKSTSKKVLPKGGDYRKLW